MSRELTEFFCSHRDDRPLRLEKLDSAREILRKSGAPYLPLDEINVPYEAMLKEALALEPAAIPHRAYSEANKGWKSIVLHGLSSAHTQGAEQYGLDPEDDSLYRWTDMTRFAPVTTQFFQTQFGYEGYHRIRFMYLEPGGYILPHTDTDEYFLGPTNIALNNPQGCEFVMENAGRLPFTPGLAIKLALCNRHAVWNQSEQTRVHMIVHGSPDFEVWAPIFVRAYESLRLSLETEL